MANLFAIVVFITATLLLLHVETYMLVFIISYKRLTYYSFIKYKIILKDGYYLSKDFCSVIATHFYLSISLDGNQVHTNVIY